MPTANKGNDLGGDSERRRRWTGGEVRIEVNGLGEGVSGGILRGMGCWVEFDENREVAKITHVPLQNMEPYCIPPLGPP